MEQKHSVVDDGTAATSPHYNSFALHEQPIIKIMQGMGYVEFRGFLYGNHMKYKLRAGRKAGTNDTNKAEQYLAWYKEFTVKDGITLNGTFFKKD